MEYIGAIIGGWLFICLAVQGYKRYRNSVEFEQSRWDKLHEYERIERDGK